jgi:putative ABC transport system permease protein
MNLYRALLRLYPASFRNEYGGEMCAIFARRLRQASGPVAVLALWLEAIADVTANAARVHLELFRQDIAYSIRTLLRVPGFTTTAIVVSALGVGATTAAFSVTDHVLIRPLPFKDPDRLVRLYQDQSYRGYARMELSPANFRDWQRMSTCFETMGAFASVSLNLVGTGDPERLAGVRVTSEVLPMLGVSPALGRLFASADDREGATPTVVLSDALWRSTFGSDAAVIGRTVLLNDERHVIIGVMPPGFYFPGRDVEFWVPLRFQAVDFENRADWYLYGIGRLRDGVSVDEARAELRLVAAQLARQYPKENARNGATVVDLRSDVSRQSRLLLIALFGASMCLLLIACTTLANLLLARALARRRELAVRAALGAGRERLVRQMLTESLVLAACGGACGVLIAIAATPLVSRLVPNALPINELPGVNPRMLLFAAMATVSIALGFGVLPAARAARVDAGALAEGVRTGTGRRAERIRSVLVVAEITASVVLLVAAGLLVRALWMVHDVDPGFEPRGVVTLRTMLPLPKYATVERRSQFYDHVLDEVETLPGVERAAYITAVPLGPMGGGIWPITTDGRPAEGPEQETASLRFVTPGFFATLRIPLRAGRDVEDRDTRSTPFVAVVSESFARRHWPGESPLGRRFFMAFEERIVVGIVGHVQVRGLERPSEPQVYLPHGQMPDGGLIGYTPKDLVVRATIGTGALVPALRAIVERADPQQPISDIASYSEIIDGHTAPRQAQLRVLGGFAAVALLLAGIGLHGLLAFSVSARTREIGVRIALGAASRDILGMVVRHGVVLAGLGLIFGLALAYAAGRSMQAILAGVSPADATAVGGAVALVLVATLAGTLAPALRAARVDPLVAIRSE